MATFLPDKAFSKKGSPYTCPGLCSDMRAADFSSLGDMFRWRMQATPDAIAFHQYRGTDWTSYSYRDLREAAEALALRLLEENLL